MTDFLIDLFFSVSGSEKFVGEYEDSDCKPSN